MPLRCRHLYMRRTIMSSKQLLLFVFAVLCISKPLLSQTYISDVAPQPLLAQAIRLNDALSYLGSSLAKEDARILIGLQDKAFTEETSKRIQAVLDPYCLALVDINSESRVKVMKGPALAKLSQDGWTSFLVKVHNQAGVTAKLEVESLNAQPVLFMSMFPFPQHAPKDELLTEGQIANRFLEVELYHNPPLSEHLSGLNVEYVVLQIYSRDAGQHEAELAFNIGQGTQDIGFRNAINILFNIQPAVKVVLRVKDDGVPVMASFIFTDGIERLINDSTTDIKTAVDYRLTIAQIEDRESWFSMPGYMVPKRLTGIYPLPSRRLATRDEYPDFFFQPQVYRSDGEHVNLPPGKYMVRYTRGPEYLPQTKALIVPTGVDSMEATFELKRWINMANLGWYSADHHIHAAGCSHYESPEEGVRPSDMWRQIVGEDLSVGAVLAWGPGWYHQKEFFTGTVNSLSTSKNIMRYDVEVSGFPSSHAGHVVLLGLKEDDYPGTTKIEDWPSYTLPVLKWAKSQSALTGYAHSGNGLQPITESEPTESNHNRSLELPNYVLPKMDGIGANEYVVAVAQNLVDFYSLGDTPAPWELNMLYHTWNCGFRPRISGETDYPCVYDERVGMARSYFEPENGLSFNNFLDAIKKGRSYVSEGSSHIINFSVNELEVGTGNSQLALRIPQPLKVKAQVAAYLPAEQDDEGSAIAKRALDKQPFWNLERARVGKTRKVRVELIVNGQAVDTAEIIANGLWQNVAFQYMVKQSSWLALRIFPSSHTNPIFVLVDNKPIHVLKSAEWCKAAVDQCWKMKQGNFRTAEHSAAAADYDIARKVYDRIIQDALQK
jgi:hypothetical protein